MGTINRERAALPSSSEIEAAATLILSARSYIPMGQPHPLALAAAALNNADIWAPGEIAHRPELPPVELIPMAHRGVRIRGREPTESTAYLVVVGGVEVGIATECPSDVAAPWRLSIPGHCFNLARSSRCILRATVARILTTGQIWE